MTIVLNQFFWNIYHALRCLPTATEPATDSGREDNSPYLYKRAHSIFPEYTMTNSFLRKYEAHMSVERYV